MEMEGECGRRWESGKRYEDGRIWRGIEAYVGGTRMERYGEEEISILIAPLKCTDIEYRTNSRDTIYGEGCFDSKTNHK